MSGLTFWFDVHSPWVYLASFRVGDIARKHGLGLRWRPLHLPKLMDEIGGIKPLEASPQRVAWFQQDIQDHAELLGVPLTPLSPVQYCRMDLPLPRVLPSLPLTSLPPPRH